MFEISLQAVGLWLALVNVLLTTLGGFLMYLFRRTQQNSTALMEYKLEVASDYAKKDEIGNLASRIELLGERVEKRLDRFEDKFFTNNRKEGN